MSEPIDDGGAAFPAIIPPQMTGIVINVDPGMSLRDWFAGQALAGMLDAGRLQGKGDIAAAAELTYAISDAMLTARKQGK